MRSAFLHPMVLLLGAMAISACLQLRPEEAAAPVYETLPPPTPLAEATDLDLPELAPESPEPTPTEYVLLPSPPMPSPSPLPSPSPALLESPEPPAEKVELRLIWKYETGDEVYGVDITDDGDVIIAASWDDNVYALDKNGSLLWNFRTAGSAYDAAISPAGDIVVATSYLSPKGYVYAFNVSGGLLWERGLEDLSKGIAVSQAGDRIAVGMGNDAVLMLDNKGNQLWRKATRESAWGVWDVAFAPDGGVVAGSDDTYAYFFDASGGLLRELGFGTGGYVLSVAFSADGEYAGVATHDGGVHLYRGGKLVWRYQTGRLNYGIAISSKGGYVAVGSWDKNLYLIGKAGGLLSKQPMDFYVNRLAFSGGDGYLAVASSDKNIYLFEVIRR